MQKNILILSIFFITSCNYLTESIGSPNEIIVLTSKEDRELISLNLGKVFNHSIYTPQIENEFVIKYRYPWELDEISKYSNIILSSISHPYDSTGDALIKRFNDQYSHNKSIYVLNDLYSLNQTITIINTHDVISLQMELEEHKMWLLDQYRNNLYKNISKSLFEYGKNESISNKILSIFGYSIDLQQDYQIIKSDSSKKFIWIGRGYPYRWLVLQTINKENVQSAEYLWNEIELLYNDQIPDIRISKNYRSNEVVNYKKRTRNLLRGIYEHDESETGGPFFIYVFDTKINNELILVSGFVNYPGHQKIHLLKQLELIAFTINKGDYE